MSAEPLEITVRLANDKLRFESQLREYPPIVTDSVPPLGDGMGYTPMEVFLVSLSTCSASTIVSLLRKFRKNVVSFSTKASGTRHQEHPTYFDKILLQYELVSPDATDDDMKKAIKMTEEKYCPVWAMIKGNVEVVCEFTIQKEAVNS